MQCNCAILHPNFSPLFFPFVFGKHIEEDKRDKETKREEGGSGIARTCGDVDDDIPTRILLTTLVPGRTCLSARQRLRRASEAEAGAGAGARSLLLLHGYALPCPALPCTGAKEKGSLVSIVFCFSLFLFLPLFSWTRWSL